MKIIIISDTHGNFNGLKKVVETEEPFNRLVHLGDGLEDGFRLKKIKDVPRILFGKQRRMYFISKILALSEIVTIVPRGIEG